MRKPLALPLFERPILFWIFDFGFWIGALLKLKAGLQNSRQTNL